MTHVSVVAAAGDLARARVATDADDGERAALDANKAIEVKTKVEKPKNVAGAGVLHLRAR